MAFTEPMSLYRATAVDARLSYEGARQRAAKLGLAGKNPLSPEELEEIFSRNCAGIKLSETVPAGWVTLAQAAAHTHYTEKTVRRWIVSGRTSAVQVSGVIYLDPALLPRPKTARPKSTRPPVHRPQNDCYGD